MTAPRIDVVRKRTNTTIHQLATALEHLEDLHAIGYYRHADHRARQRVTGGDPTAIGIDLDNHGDPRYRAAYQQLATTIITTNRTITTAITAALKLLDTGTITTRRDTTADATTPEVIAAIARLDQRRTHGEHTSTATIVQPLPKGATRALQVTRLQEELDALRNAVRKLNQRPDRTRLTPRELTAWHNATGTPNRQRKARKRQ